MFGLIKNNDYLAKNKVLPVKKIIFSKLLLTVEHFLLLIVFAFLPFVFSNSLIETETTFRFVISGALCSVLFITMFLSLLARSNFKSIALPRHYFYLVLLLFIAFSWYRVTSSINTGEAIYDCLKLSTIAAYFFLFSILMRNSETFLNTLYKYANVSVFIFTLIMLSQIGLQLKNTNNFKIDYMLSSSLGNKNFYSETMCLFLPIIAMGFLSIKGKWKIVSFGSLVIILITIISLQTLSTWIALIVFILFVVALAISKSSIKDTRKKSSKRIFAISTGIGIILIVSGIALYPSLHFKLIDKRLNKIAEYTKSSVSYKQEDTNHTNSISERIYLWKNAWRMYRDYPIAGGGVDNWKVYNTKYELPFSKYAINNLTRYYRPHNDVLLILAEEGTIGAILFLSLFVFSLILSFQTIKKSNDAITISRAILAASGVVIYLLIACVSLPGDRFYTQLLLFLFWAIICTDHKKSENSTLSVFNFRLFQMICLAGIGIGISTAYIGAVRYASEIHLVYALQGQAKKDWQKMGYHASKSKNYFFPIDFNASPLAWHQGVAAFHSGSPSIAKLYFEEALKSNPYDLNVLNDLATCIDREGNDAGALKIYNQILVMAPLYSDAYLNRLVVLYRQGYRDSAYALIHLFPNYQNEESSKDILIKILSEKATAAIQDTIVSKKYIKQKRNLLRLDSIANSNHSSFEKLVLQDTLARIK